MKRIAFAALLVCALSCVAGAEERLRKSYVTGGRLGGWLTQYTSARHDEGADDGTYYTVGKGWGYVVGVLDSRSEDIVIPVGAKLRDVLTIVARYLQSHPEVSNEPASDLVILALKEESARRMAKAEP